jgi:hypothetical protein
MSYVDFFLNSDSKVVELELLEISHPDFSQVYRIVRNKISGVTVTLEDSSVETFDYYPLQIKPTASSDDLDQKLEIILGDLGSVLPMELDNVNVAGTFGIKPVCIYRTYRSDDLSAPLNGPIEFEIRNISFKKQGASFDAVAPRLNVNSTGEIYSIDRFPMLAGFL